MIHVVRLRKAFFNQFSIDEEKPFYAHYQFWIVWVSFPLVAALFFAQPIFENYELKLSKDGYDTFFEVMKLPLWLAGLSIAGGIFFARMHASKQRSRQIEQTEKNNNFKLFYEHREYFEGYLKGLFESGGPSFSEEIKLSSGIETSFGIETNKRYVIGYVNCNNFNVDSRALYNYVFPDNKPTFFSSEIQFKQASRLREISNQPLCFYDSPRGSIAKPNYKYVSFGVDIVVSSKDSISPPRAGSFNEFEAILRIPQADIGRLFYGLDKIAAYKPLHETICSIAIANKILEEFT